MWVFRPRLNCTTGMTTPDPVRLQRAFRQFADAGLGACAIEASSIGWPSTAWMARRSAWRCSPTSRRTIWTTTAPWPTTGRPSACLFDWPGLRAAVINIDDATGRSLHAELPAHAPALDLWSVSTAGRRALPHVTSARRHAGLQWLVVEGAGATCCNPAWWAITTCSNCWA